MCADLYAHRFDNHRRLQVLRVNNLLVAKDGFAMMSKSMRELSGLIVAFSLIISFSFAATQAQQNSPKDDETLINDARAELQTLLSAPPPSGSSSEAVFKVSVI